MRRDAFWSGLEASISAVLSIVAAFVVARIVGSAELGIGAAITAVHVVLWVVVNALFADALVQRAKIDARMVFSALWASCLVGCLAMLMQGVAGWGLVAMFGDNRLLPMALVLALPLPLVGAAGVIQGLLTRQGAYRRLALRTLIGQGLGTAVGVWMALSGAGAWAVVCQQATTSSCGALALLLISRPLGQQRCVWSGGTIAGEEVWHPALCLDWPTVGNLLRVGIPLTASTLVSIGRYRLFAVLVGSTAGAAVLGQVHIAFRLVDTVKELTFTALWRLMLPALSQHQHDRQAMLRHVDQWLRRCVIAIFPLCAILAAGLSSVVGLLMGPGWAATSHATLPLIALMGWSTLMFPSGVALVAFGQVRLTLYANLANLGCSAAGILLFRPTTPWQAVMIWTVSQVIVSPYIIWANARALRVGILRPLSGGFAIRSSS